MQGLAQERLQPKPSRRSWTSQQVPSLSRTSSGPNRARQLAAPRRSLLHRMTGTTPRSPRSRPAEVWMLRLTKESSEVSGDLQSFTEKQ